MKQSVDIDKLWVDDDAKKLLKIIEKMAASENVEVKNAIPSLMVVSDIGCGLSSYSRAYGELLEEFSVFRIKGKNTFLELVFPKDNPQDEKLFFSSPRRAAATKNRFYGTFLISFSEYEGKDLLKSEGFLRLMEYVEQNRENVYFVFHVLPHFTEKSRLLAKLALLLNVKQIHLKKPDEEKSFAYLMEKIKGKGMELADGCGEYLNQSIIEKLIKSNSYAGYITLNNVVQRVYYEMVLRDEKRIVNKEMINSALMDYLENETYSLDRNIGFHI